MKKLQLLAIALAFLLPLSSVTIASIETAGHQMAEINKTPCVQMCVAGCEQLAEGVEVKELVRYRV